MDLLEKITELQDARGWSNSQLAKNAGVPISTINSFFQRQNDPSYSTLTGIAQAFGLSTSQLLAEDDTEPFYLSEEEKNWNAIYVKSNKEKIAHIMALLKE